MFAAAALSVTRLEIILSYRKRRRVPCPTVKAGSDQLTCPRHGYSMHLSDNRNGSATNAAPATANAALPVSPRSQAYAPPMMITTIAIAATRLRPIDESLNRLHLARRFGARPVEHLSPRDSTGSFLFIRSAKMFGLHLRLRLLPMYSHAGTGGLQPYAAIPRSRYRWQTCQPAQQDSMATSLSNVCAANFNPSTVVR